jgi:hypothetical protein
MLFPLLGFFPWYGEAAILLILGALSYRFSWLFTRWNDKRKRYLRQRRLEGHLLHTFEACGLALKRPNGTLETPDVDSYEDLAGDGLRIALRLPVGMHRAQVQNALPAIVAAFEMSSGEIEIDRLHAERVTLNLIGSNDPLYQDDPLVRLQDLQLPTSNWIEDGVPIGFRSTGEVVRILLWNRSVLIGGIPRSGKSAFIQGFLCAQSKCKHVELHLCDIKRVEFKFWRNVAASISREFDEAVEQLEMLKETMKARYEYMEASDRPDSQNLVPSKEYPQIVYICDELSELLNEAPDKKTRDHIEGLLRSLTARGPASGITVVLCTQKPTSDVVPTNIRDLMSTRVCFRTTTAPQSLSILGEAMKELELEPHNIPQDKKGIAYMFDEVGGAFRFKGLFLTAAEIRAYADKAALRRDSEISARDWQEGKRGNLVKPDLQTIIKEETHLALLQTKAKGLGDIHCLDHAKFFYDSLTNEPCPTCFRESQLYMKDHMPELYDLEKRLDDVEGIDDKE